MSFVSFGAGFSLMTVGFSIKKNTKKKLCPKKLHQGSNAEKFTSNSSALKMLLTHNKIHLALS
jgi:hypothetical protein